MEHQVVLVWPYLLQVLVQEVEDEQQEVLELLFEHLVALTPEATQVALEWQLLLQLVLGAQLRQELELLPVLVVSESSS